MKYFTFTILLLCLIFVTPGCSGCSTSGRRNVDHKKSSGSDDNAVPTETNADEEIVSADKTILKMEKIAGVYQIPTEINGIPMYFIFDTGASMISISQTEANFLYKQGKLTEEDILGKANFTDANGDISEGTIINLKTVKLGNRELNNVQASVVNNLDAPLLMGQSALENFGKISIDYQKGEITLE